MIETDRLQAKTMVRFEGGEGRQSLSRLCGELLRSQRETWTALDTAYAALDHVKTREIECTGFQVVLQHNPLRARSVTAKVNDRDIRERPCFLCPANLPSPQKGILYRDEYLILCNPMPIVPFHLTISHTSHRPQGILGHADTLLALACDLGPAWLLLYNGPRCGASAPDHLHFQAVPAGHTPLEREIREPGRRRPLTSRGGTETFRADRLGREVIVVEGVRKDEVTAALTAIAAPGFAADDEVPLNLVAAYREGQWSVVIFPRSKHRPGAFFAEGDGRIVVSPAVLEMAGLIVTPVGRDFERLDAATVEGIYREVSSCLE